MIKDAREVEVPDFWFSEAYRSWGGMFPFILVGYDANAGNGQESQESPWNF